MNDIPERWADDIDVETAVARLLDTTERIASSLERIVALIENGIEKEDEHDEPDDDDDDDEDDDEDEEHIDLFGGIGGIRKGFEGDKSCPERGEKRN